MALKKIFIWCLFFVFSSLNENFPVASFFYTYDFVIFTMLLYLKEKTWMP